MRIPACAHLVAPFAAGLAAMLLSMPVKAQLDPSCGQLDNPYGPFDYRTQRHLLPIVERRHFTPVVEGLIRGSTTTQPGPDISDTLRAFPNHHRALAAVMRLGEKTKSPHPSGLAYRVECYFLRAVAFAPDDTVARVLYARYLGQASRADDARHHLALAALHAKGNPVTHQNIGLVYYEIKDYDKALAAAHEALRLGLDPVELRHQLTTSGHWKEPGPHPDAAPDKP